MKKILPYLLTISFLQIGFSQNDKTLHGSVVFQLSPLRDVEIINWNKKTITKSDNDGNFYISCSINDTLYFLSKNHIDKKVGIKKSDFQLDVFTISLDEKTIDLEEIKIIKNLKSNIKITSNQIANAKVERDERMPTNPAVDMNTIQYGLNFVAIGKAIGKLFKNKDGDNKSKDEQPDFKNTILLNFDTNYFIKVLNLKPDEIGRFVSFCNQDPLSKNSVEHQNMLTMMDFLMLKSKEYKSLK